ncbi:MAG: hypothetical protein JXR71_09595 [Bacteroidales bacterium]|nr:hypothetical protein [Bacteroidales bacterium]
MKILRVLSKLTMTGAFLVLATSLFAQTNTTTQDLTMGIPEVLLINAVDTTGVTAAVSLELTTNVAGTAISGGSGASYAQVSSIIASGQTRKIQASYDQIPAGTTLDVTGDLPTSTNGDGTFGSTANTVTLSTTAQDIFTGVGSCFTGTSAKDGYRLNWQWNAGAAGQYANIVATTGSTTVVTLTITAGN